MCLTTKQKKDGMMRLFLISVFSVLFLCSCASTSFVKKEIQRVENRAVSNEMRIARLEKEVVEVKEDSHSALALASQALWKDKVSVTELIPYLAEREINFAFDRYELSKTAKATLDGIGRMLRLNPEYKLTIEGHTDSIASDIYNHDLGRRRAEEVKRYLVEKFNIPLQRIFSLTFGESAPRTSNTTSAGRATNRRVVLQIWVPM